MRVINENDFVNIKLLLSQKSTFKNDITTFTINNKTFYRNDKSLNYQHITIKNFENRSLEFKFELLHFEKNRYSHCKVYQYNNECHEIKRKSKF